MAKTWIESREERTASSLATGRNDSEPIKRVKMESIDCSLSTSLESFTGSPKGSRDIRDTARGGIETLLKREAWKGNQNQ